MNRFRGKVERLCEGLQRVEGFRVARPAGTFYVFPDVRTVCNRLRITSHGLAYYLLEGADDQFGIACLGGECFGEAGRGFLRFSCAEPNDRIDQAMEFLPKALDRRDRVRQYLEANPHYRLREPYEQRAGNDVAGEAECGHERRPLAGARVVAERRSRVSPDRWAAAVKHLRRVDPHLKAIIDRIGPCRLEPHPDRFAALVRSIVGQQISTKAARSINLKLIALGGDPPRPETFDRARGAGIENRRDSRVPRLGIFSIWPRPSSVGSYRSRNSTTPGTTRRSSVSLTAVKGIGVWTAEMFLIFVMNRPDVLPAGDLGVRAALRDRHGLPSCRHRVIATRWPSHGGRTARSRAGTSGGASTRPKPASGEACRSARRPVPARQSAVAES